MSSQGIQGHDVIPIQVWEDFKDLFERYLPGWQSNGIYNYRASASTQMAAVQLEQILHSGSHPWINDALMDLLRKFDALEESKKTTALGALVNFLFEAQDLSNLDNAGKTGGYVAFTSLRDPHLIDAVGYQPDKAYLTAYNEAHLTWDNILNSAAGKEVEALNLRVSNGHLFYDGKLGNGSFFSVASDEIGSFKTYLTEGDRKASTAFSADWVEKNGVKVIANGAVTVDGKAIKYEYAEEFLKKDVLNGHSIADFDYIPKKSVPSSRITSANSGLRRFWQA